ncbi:vitellogenin 3, phosvitinless [Pundamilia nyererei]|uniref:Vitellogenin 3, phosvitinless n=1 Tax=Pundamilia nyererei TaxID=303518 RepID=A0A9Y3R4P2_9CICH|nr:PREDICTED: vitellogenin-like [Pundamilia nyererei]
MRGLVFFFCCLVALATCQAVRYDLTLNHRKTYEYKYEGEVKFGSGKPNRAESGVRIQCNIKISGESPQVFILQVSDVTFAELNGITGKSDFSQCPKLSQRIAAQLAKPFKFEHINGHVRQIQAAPDVTETTVNIVRGMLSFFHATVKTSPTVYELEEVGIHGMCQNNYATEINKQTNNMNITQVVDIDHCRIKAAVQNGMAFAVLDKETKQRGESMFSTVQYLYTIQPTEEGGMVKSAYALEQQHFSPFNVKRGSFRMEAKKEMVLIRVSEGGKPANVGQLQNRGDIVHNLVNSNANIPLVMQDLAEPKAKAIRMIKQLAEDHKNQIKKETTEDTLKVYQLLRMLQDRDLDEMWVELARNNEHRRFFLDMVAEINDDRVLKFLQKRFQAKDVSANEAVQTLLIAMNHLQPRAELVEKAKEIMNMEFIKSNPHLWTAAMFSFGSLVYKYCAYHSPCPQAAVQPLLNLANEGLRNHNETKMFIALRALGNAGHPGSIKTITNFLPGVAANPVDVSCRLQSAAMQALRLTARRDPHNVQEIALKVFLQKSCAPETNMMAIMVMFNTKPSAALVSTLTAHLEREKDIHLASFAYSYLENIARSKTPDNHYLSIYCSLAVKSLAAKFGRLSYNSRSFRMDMFDDDLLMGTSASLNMLGGPTSILPTEIISQQKYFAIGRIMRLMEFGIRSETLKQLIGPSIPGFKGDFSFSDFQAIYNALKNWESLPNDKPIISAYSRLSGQEFFFVNIQKDLLEYIKAAVSPSAPKGTPVWAAIEQLQKGLSWHWTKPLLNIEARLLQATTLGLPVEIAKYYQTVTGITINAKAAINPPQVQHLGDLMNADISLESEGVVGFTKDFWIFHGINTELFQCGSEMKSKAPVELPLKLSAKINVGKRVLELDIPACKNEFELISFSSNLYAVSRNIGDPESPKRTPMIPDEFNSQQPTPNNWWRKANMCAKSSMYGVGVCVDYDIRRQYFNNEYPLYSIMGFTHAAIRVVPAEATKPVEKIHLEVQCKPASHPLTIRHVYETMRRIAQERSQEQSNSASNERETRNSQEIMMDATAPQPVVSIKAIAMSGNQNLEGFDVTLYNPSEGDTLKAQMIVSHIGDAANWKMCVDASAQSPANVKAMISWGAQCKPYKISVMTAAAQSPAPRQTLEAKVEWANVPEEMVNYCSRMERYIPGMALLSGFNQTFESNANQEVSASIVCASSDSIDVTIKLPKYTVFRQAVPLPFSSASFRVENTERNEQA